MSTNDKKILTGPPYKGEKGHWLMRPLFVDIPMPHATEDDTRRNYEPIFSLYGPVEGYIDVRTTFIELEDPTGLLWAERYLGSWEHWKRLQEASWFATELSKWRDELDAIELSRAIKKIKELSQGDTSAALPAAKYLAEKGWQKARGRPSKAEIAGELKKQVEIVEAHTNDAARMGLTIVQGGKA